LYSSTTTSFVGIPDAGFLAIPPLANPSQGLTIAFVSFNGEYLSPSNDLWLPAHQEITFASAADNFSNDTLELRYTIDNPLSVLGCAEQHQYCNPNSKATNGSNCTPLTNRADLFFDGMNASSNSLYSTVFTNLHQLITIAAINDAAGLSSVDTWLSGMDVPLLAADLNVISSSEGLADNQWILETTNWFATSMNILQRSVAEYATGPPGKLGRYTAGNSSTVPELDWFCKNVVVENNSYVSFSMLSLCLIFIIGLLLILVSLWIESLVKSIQLRLKKGKSFERRWYLDSALQLHRMAFESAGLGSWKDGPKEIPLTEKPEKIGVEREWDTRRGSLKEKVVEGIRPVSPATPGFGSISRETTLKSDTETLLKRQSV
jgi:hypothetical protein